MAYERLQKILSGAGVVSRRGAEKLIVSGRVKVNGIVSLELGTKADADRDVVTVDDKRIRAKKKVYFMFHKPKGVVTTMKDPEGRRCLGEFVRDIGITVFPVGRLDYNTEGLLLLTNDGKLAQRLTHPSYEVKKTYLVIVVGIVPQAKFDRLRMGVELDDGITAPAVVNLRYYDNKKKLTLFDITICEGRNRQVRRMCDAIGFPVRELKRIRIGTLNLGGLGKGKIRELDEREIRELDESELC